MPQEIVSAYLSRLAFKEDLGDLESRWAANDNIFCLILFELELGDKVLEGKDEVGLLQVLSLDLLKVEVVIEKIR